MVCHFLTIEHILSQVRSTPWKSQAGFALNILRNYLHLSKGSFVIMRISKIHFKNTTLEAIRCDFVSLSSCGQCFPTFPCIEHSWCFHIIPMFLTKWVNHFLAPFLPPFVRHLFLPTVLVTFRKPKGQTHSLLENLGEQGRMCCLYDPKFLLLIIPASYKSSKE